MENPSLPIKTVYGIFKDNLITCEGVEIVECTTYVSFSKEIEGRYGFHQLKYSNNICTYIISNFVEFPLDEYKKLFN